MFCPQCRHTWPSSAAVSDSPSAKPPGAFSRWRKARSRAVLCPLCQGPLVPDRLEQEFPPVAHASKSEPSMSMADILREIGPLTTSPGSGGSDDARTRTASSGLDGDLVSVSSLGSRRLRKKLVPFDTVLGFGALAVTAAMMIILGVGIVWNATRTPLPRSAVVTASVPARPVLDTGSVTNWPAASILAMLPATLPGGWQRWEPDASLTQGENAAATGQRVAAYQCGAQTVHVWLLKTPNNGDALTAFGGAARFVHSHQALVRQPPVPVHLYGHDCLMFDDPLPLSIPHYIEASYPFDADAFTLTWYSQGTLVTVASDDKAARDDFARAYAPQH